MRGRIVRVLLLALVLAGCGLGRGNVVDIDPMSLPQRLVGSSTPSPTNTAEPARATGDVYFSSDEVLVQAMRTLNAAPGQPALQELLDDLSAGPDGRDRERGYSSALPPATRLRVTSLQGDVAIVDLAVDQPPPDQTTAIAQIVLTTTSLPGVRRVRLTFNGKPINAPLANGAQTNRLLTRGDYEAMLIARP
ncbi:MAG TPA: GerMN domain-containing protein [Sporichthyaceae bacterium]|jgi:spore germination protein GerM